MIRRRTCGAVLAAVLALATPGIGMAQTGAAAAAPGPALSFNHYYIAISVGDIDAVAAFYIDHLGFRLEKDAALGTAVRFRYLTNGNARIELIAMNGSKPGPDMPPPPGHLGTQGYSHFALESTDLEATRAALIASGVENVGAISNLAPLGFRAMFVMDPEGNPIEIIQRNRD
jgi:glyoxylase I family protein